MPVLQPISQSKIQYIPFEGLGHYCLDLLAFEDLGKRPPSEGKEVLQKYVARFRVTKYSPAEGVNASLYPEIAPGRVVSMVWDYTPKEVKRVKIHEIKLREVSALMYALAGVDAGTPVEQFDPNTFRDQLEAMSAADQLDGSLKVEMVRKLTKRQKEVVVTDRDGRAKRDENGAVIVETKRFTADYFEPAVG